MGLNDYFHVIENFDQNDLNLVKDFYWKHIHPLHISQNSNNITVGQKVSYFSFTHKMIYEARHLLEKYPFLGLDGLVNDSSLTMGTKIHIDGTMSRNVRLCAVIFPIEGGHENSPTIFYGKYQDYESYYDTFFGTTFITSTDKPITPVTQVSIIDKPVLINVKSWHQSVNNATDRRLAFSWSCKYNMDYFTARQELLK